MRDELVLSSSPDLLSQLLPRQQVETMVEGHATIAVFYRDVDAESLLLPVDDELGPVYLVLNCDVFNGVVAREREAAPQEPHLVDVSVNTEYGTLSVTQLGVAEMNPVVAGLPTRLVPRRKWRRRLSGRSRSEKRRNARG